MDRLSKFFVRYSELGIFLSDLKIPMRVSLTTEGDHPSDVENLRRVLLLPLQG